VVLRSKTVAPQHVGRNAYIMIYHLNLLGWFGLFLLALPCHTFAQQQEENPYGDLNKSQISISHSACRGRCPVYDLTLLPDGLVLYNGIRNVKLIGKGQSRIESGTYRDLLRRVTEINFFSLPECVEADDAPSVSIAVLFNNKKKILWYSDVMPLYCGEELKKLQGEIEIIVNSKQWVGR
jgi:hypothetical protein